MGGKSGKGGKSKGGRKDSLRGKQKGYQMAIIQYCETVKKDIFKGLKREVKDNLMPQARVAIKDIQE